MLRSEDEKKAATHLYLKVIIDNAQTVKDLLAEGHNEAAAMLQGKVCDQLEEALKSITDIFYPTTPETTEDEPEPEPKKLGIRSRKSVTV